jgi:hypothetical protein
MLFTDEELASYPGTEGVSEATAELLRDLAEARIYAVLPADIADTSAVAKGIALEVVARAYRNPNGYAAENVDDYGYRRPAATASSGVYLTADERSELASLNPDAPRPRVRSVRLRSWSGPL